MYQTLTFGSGPQADVLIQDPYVSDVHCAIVKFYTGAGEHIFMVSDLASTSGTWIIKPSGKTFRIRETTALIPGDLVKIGRTVLPWRT